MSPAMMALVVAIAGMMLPAIAARKDETFSLRDAALKHKQTNHPGPETTYT